MRLECRVNGREVSLEAQPLARLIDVLRGDLGLVAAREGCGEGRCGACSVFLDGELVNSCMVPAAQVRGREIETLEGISSAEGGLHPLQEILAESEELPCASCLPGMIMAGLDHLRHRSPDAPRPDVSDLRRVIAGNLCRCAAYESFIEAIARLLDEGGA